MWLHPRPGTISNLKVKSYEGNSITEVKYNYLIIIFYYHINKRITM